MVAWDRRVSDVTQAWQGCLEHVQCQAAALVQLSASFAMQNPIQTGTARGHLEELVNSATCPAPLVLDSCCDGLGTALCSAHSSSREQGGGQSHPFSALVLGDDAEGQLKLSGMPDALNSPANSLPCPLGGCRGGPGREGQC